MLVCHDWVRRAAAVVVLALLALNVALTVVTHDPWATNDGLAIAMLAAYAAVGYVIARTQPRNPIPWIFLGLSILTLIDYALQLYLVLDYRQRGGSLPLGNLAVFWRGSWSLFPILFAFPAILLFPDGRLSPRWRTLLRTYVVAAVVFMGTQVAGQIVHGAGRIVVDIRGNLPYADGGTVGGVGWLLVPFFLAAWCAFVWRQLSAWRASSGAERAQLKWLALGGVAFAISVIVIVIIGDASSTASRVAADVGTLGVAVVPIAIGVAILRYRLYEIDRIISRTLAYALLTALLVGTFAGIVLLTTRVLPFSSPVAVAASTLAAAALFNPLRTRVQRLVDRRFNRARYDREALVTAFVARLRDAVDSETVASELAGAAASAVEPASVSIWVRG